MSKSPFRSFHLSGGRHFGHGAVRLAAIPLRPMFVSSPRSPLRWLARLKSPCFRRGKLASEWCCAGNPRAKSKGARGPSSTRLPRPLAARPAHLARGPRPARTLRFTSFRSRVLPFLPMPSSRGGRRQPRPASRSLARTGARCARNQTRRWSLGARELAGRGRLRPWG